MHRNDRKQRLLSFSYYTNSVIRPLTYAIVGCTNHEYSKELCRDSTDSINGAIQRNSVCE